MISDMANIAKIGLTIRMTVMRIVPSNMTKEHVTDEEIARVKEEITDEFLKVDDDGVSARIETFDFSLMEID